MPTSTAKSTPVDTSNSPQINGNKSKAKPQIKKTRVIRRRGRGRGTVESDDEIEREAATDSDSDDQHSLSSPSDSDSDTEPASDDVVPVVQSPRVATIMDPTLSRIDVSEDLVASSLPNGKQQPSSFFQSNGDWSDMVNDENEHGSADLPVIDYADFDGDVTRQPTTQPPPNKKKQMKKAKAALKAKERTAPAPAPEPESEVAGVESEDAVDGPPHSPTHAKRLSNDFKRPNGQTARQAYQNRLEADPSFIPTVGEFWGHDDRLMDKGLRSLSGWWRGRWQNGGRGRGGFGMGVGRGRGRGGVFAAPAERPEAEELPPIEKAWGHDGFEEMKQREMHFAAIKARRGGASPRGARGGFLRGGFAPPARGRPHFLASSDRPWHTVKPEKAFTRHHESFLFQEPVRKPFKGNTSFVRVKLGSEAAKTVHMVTRPVKKQKSALKAKAKTPDDQPFVVRMPPAKIATSDPPVPVVVEEPPPPPLLPEAEVAPPSAEKDDVEEVFKVRPHLVPAPVYLSKQPSAPRKASVEHDAPKPTRSPPPHMVAPVTITSQPEIVRQLERLALEAPQPTFSAPQPDQSGSPVVLEEPPVGSPLDSRPALYPLQTVFSPSAVHPVQPVQKQPTPPYNSSPYGYPAPLPPGIAMDPHGVPYEVSTGRPVYFQPPMPIYNPRPLLPPPFVPGHMHHHSSAEFYPHHQSPSHTPPVNNGYVDPTIFSMPRSSRVQIRAPDGSAPPPLDTGADKGYSQLNPNTLSFEPMQPSAHENPQMMESGYSHQQHYFSPGHYPQEEQQGMDPVMMGYQGYTQYYYPQENGYAGDVGGYAGDGYAYGHYMDMSQMGQYDMYPHPQDAHTAHAPPVFY